MKLRKKQPQPEGISGYDYSDRAARERTAYALFRRAKNARTAVEIEWEKYNDYYNGIHDVTRDITEFCRENDIPWLPASIPDPYILVESQIEPTVPQPEFRGRDDDLDSAMAKRREFAVRYIAENNRLSDMNTRNERRLLKLGDAFWKAYWDEDMRCGEAQGDIRVSDIPVEAVFQAGEDAWIIGGESVYRRFLPLCDRVYITKIFADGHADAFFPDLGAGPDWEMAEEEEPQEHAGIPFRYVTYRRRKPHVCG